MPCRITSLSQGWTLYVPSLLHFRMQHADSACSSQRLELSAPTRLLGPRKILKEGQVSKVKSGRQLQAYLFNDLLLFTEMKKPGSEVVYRWVSRRRFLSRVFCVC